MVYDNVIGQIAGAGTGSLLPTLHNQPLDPFYLATLIVTMQVLRSIYTSPLCVYVTCVCPCVVHIRDSFCSLALVDAHLDHTTHLNHTTFSSSLNC